MTKFKITRYNEDSILVEHFKDNGELFDNEILTWDYIKEIEIEQGPTIIKRAYS